MIWVIVGAPAANEQHSVMSQRPLEYQTPAARQGGARYGLAFVGAAFGLVVTLPAIVMAIASGGAGHGDYAFARALFPVPMLLTLVTGDRISLPLIVLALAQFSIYGGLVGYCAGVSRRAVLMALAGVVLVHLLAAIACFSGALPNFSGRVRCQGNGPQEYALRRFMNPLGCAAVYG